MVDFREFTYLAVKDMSKKNARLVGKALDVAIMFGVLEYASGNESLQDLAVVRAELEKRMQQLRELSERD